MGLAVLATAASARTAMKAGVSSPAALADGYDLVFLAAAGLGLAVAVTSVPLPWCRRG
ncbi:hypothetical protein [Micromonospora psammae]|uniref:hypothetical protein n=1 Tax=Micromonospora sp. CPCC 205556 TaxID=3122398 RepID=UPI002FF11C48